jgi:hypothetical protein
MRNDDIPDFLSLFRVESQRNTSGVNRDTFVYQKTGQTLFRGCVAVAVESAG